MGEIAIWTPDQQNIERSKHPSKILCASWTPDGQLVAIGTLSGQITIRDKKLNEKLVINKRAPVWCLEWTPFTSEISESTLIVGCWDQTLSFYVIDKEGKTNSTEKSLDFDPCSISCFGNGEFFIVTGSNSKGFLWTKEGICLGQLCEKKSWIWSAKVRPKQNIFAIGTNDGGISLHQITFHIVHGLYKDRYVYRDLLTDLVVQHLITDQKVRLKCKELVKKVSIYKDRLAVQLLDKILIYTVSQQEVFDMKYKLLKKINKKVECSLLVVTSNHVIFCMEKKLSLMNLNGDFEREWILDSLIRYIKVIGGQQKREGLLVGLKNGTVLKIFLDNAFPVILCKQEVPIRCVDLSIEGKLLAIVDDNANLTVIDLHTKETLFQEMNVNSVAWNMEIEGNLAYSGNGLLFIKSGLFPAYSQKMNGFVVGFKGSKLFVLNYLTMQTIDVPQTLSVVKYIERKDYITAYKVACSGSTDQDFKILGIEALKYGDFDTAMKCFVRIRDLPFIELTNKFERERANNNLDDVEMAAKIAAYQGKLDDVGEIYQKANRQDKMIQFYIEIKKFPKIKNMMDKDAMTQMATWLYDTGELDRAGELFSQAGDIKMASQIFVQTQKWDKLQGVLQNLTKSEHKDQIGYLGEIFKKNGLHQMAKEAFLKLGDIKSLMQLHIELERWDEAKLLAKNNPELFSMMMLPFAEHLEKQDKFEEALEAYKEAGQFDKTMRILQRLSQNCALQNRFKDASHFFWLLAKENLANIQNFNDMSAADLKSYNLFVEFNDVANIYYAYETIHNFIEEPLQAVTGPTYYAQIFNAARLIISKLENIQSPYGISQAFFYLALAKVSVNLEAFKTARVAYEKLAGMKVNADWIEQIELNNLLLRGKPFSDKDTLQSICNRCATPNPILLQGERCSQCFHGFHRSMISFATLPLCEFKLAKGITHRRAMELFYSDKTQTQGGKGAKKKQGGRGGGGGEQDGWTESKLGNEQVLTFSHQNGNITDKGTTGSIFFWSRWRRINSIL